MADEDRPGPLTDPLLAQDVFANGIIVEMINGDFRLTAWVDVDGDRRIMARLVITNGAARALAKDLKKAVAKGGH